MSSLAHLVPSAGVLTFEADGNLFRFRFLGLGQGDDQQAVFVVGLHLLVLHVDRERHGAHKFARRPFTPVEGFGLNLGGDTRLLARNGQAVVLHGKLDGRSDQGQELGP